MKKWLFKTALYSPSTSSFLITSQYSDSHCIIAAVRPNHPRTTDWLKKQRWRISDASFPFPSSFNGNFTRSKASGAVTRLLRWYSASYNTKFMDVTEPKREFDKHPQLRLLILAERVLVMADPLWQGHGVKTQHWNEALISSSSDPSQSSQITRLDRSQWQLTTCDWS